MSRRSTVLTTAAFAAVATLAWRRRRGGSTDDPGVLGPEAVRHLYDRLAPVYDALKGAYGLTADTHRWAVEALGLRPGGTAVDLACGTGANLPHLVRAVGPEGRVVGVDLSPGMLGRARRRVEEAGWTNVELVQADVRVFGFPEPVHGVVSTFGLEMVPEVDAVVARAARALAPGGRIATSGLRRPDRWPAWAVRLGAWITRPFGVTEAYEAIQPWRAVQSRTTATLYEERLLGAAYLAVGTTPTGQPDAP